MCISYFLGWWNWKIHISRKRCSYMLRKPYFKAPRISHRNSFCDWPRSLTWCLSVLSKIELPIFWYRVTVILRKNKGRLWNYLFDIEMRICHIENSDFIPIGIGLFTFNVNPVITIFFSPKYFRTIILHVLFDYSLHIGHPFSVYLNNLVVNYHSLSHTNGYKKN